MKAWSTAQACDGTMVKFMGDPSGALTKALGITLDHPGVMGVLGYPRCKRSAFVVEKGIVKTVKIAEAADDPAGDSRPDETLVENILSEL